MQAVGEGIEIFIRSNNVIIYRRITIKYIIINLLFIYGIMHFVNLSIMTIVIVELLLFFPHIFIRKVKILDKKNGYIIVFYTILNIKISKPIQTIIDKNDSLSIVYHRNKGITEAWEIPYSVYLQEKYDKIPLLAVSSEKTIKRMYLIFKDNNINFYEI